MTDKYTRLALELVRSHEAFGGLWLRSRNGESQWLHLEVEGDVVRCYDAERITWKLGAEVERRECVGPRTRLDQCVWVPHDATRRPISLSAFGLPRYRADGVKALQMLAVIDAKDVVFTCDSCPERPTCGVAFDPYNTDGDCLVCK